MSRIVIIADGRLDITMSPDHTWDGAPSSTLMQAAAKLAANGHKPLILTEVGMDQTGNIVVDFMQDHDLDISCINRYTEGITPLAMHTPHGVSLITKYTDQQGLDVTWPRIDKEDVVVFGGYAALTRRWATNLGDLLDFALTRGATTVYVPDDSLLSTVTPTKVMPQFFENLEKASWTLLNSRITDIFFNNKDVAETYRRNIAFHCPQVIAYGSTDGAVALQGEIPSLLTPILQAI